MKISRDEYYLKVLESIRLRSTCDRGKSGALIVVRNRVVATGYVGSPPGLPHCDDIGHMMQGDHCIRTVHAEMNAILQAAKFGTPVENGTMYCTMVPCFSCAKSIVSAGIWRVVAVYDYHDSLHSKYLLHNPMQNRELTILNPGSFCYDCRSVEDATKSGLPTL